MLLPFLAGAWLALSTLKGTPARGPALPVVIGLGFAVTITVVIALFIARPGGNCALPDDRAGAGPRPGSRAGQRPTRPPGTGCECGLARLCRPGRPPGPGRRPRRPRRRQPRSALPSRPGGDACAARKSTGPTTQAGRPPGGSTGRGPASPGRH